MSKNFCVTAVENLKIKSTKKQKKRKLIKIVRNGREKSLSVCADQVICLS